MPYFCFARAFPDSFSHCYLHSNKKIYKLLFKSEVLNHFLENDNCEEHLST